MTHRRAVLLMLLVTLMWSSAGVVTRHLDAARSFEVTFWRSFFTAVSLGIYLGWQHGRGALRAVSAGGKPLWISGAMWSVMFTCFMVALTLTTVANVLITMSVAPLITAVMARFTLGTAVSGRTWASIAAAGLGIAWMYSDGLSADPRHLLGTLVALGVPVAAAVNWTVMQRNGTRVDLVPALLVGALLSCAYTLPLSFPFAGSWHDVTLLAGLGVFQLAIPCILAVNLARRLPAPEIALLALLEIVFGIAWAWWGAGEEPSSRVLSGGLIVIATLALNEWAAMRSRR